MISLWQKRFVLIVAVSAFCLLRCDERGKNELECDQYFLSTIGDQNGKIILNANYKNGLLSGYLNRTDTMTSFSYNQNQQVKARKTGSMKALYFYDNTNRLKYLMEYYNGSFIDSIALTYNPANLISTMTYYTYSLNGLGATKRIEYDYIGRNSSVARFFQYDNDTKELKLSSTFLFEYDNMRRPFPGETFPFYYLFDNGTLSENNVTRQILRIAGQPDFETKYSYNYNSDGVPTEMRSNGVVMQRYTYSCTPE